MKTTIHSYLGGGSTRRNFIQQCAAMAGSGVSASILQLKMTQSLLAQQPLPRQNLYDDYRALVCLYLDGGNDSFNMLTPYELEEYDDYLEIRTPQSQSGLALERNELHVVGSRSGRRFGMHPATTELHQLYTEGDLAFIANVGSLIEPVDLGDYQSGNNLPLGLFSHSDLKRHWQTSMPQSRSAITGWGGRTADILTDPSQASNPISMSISINDVTQFLTASSINPYVVAATGATEHIAHSSNWGPDLIFSRAFDKVLERPDSNLFQKTYADSFRQSIDAATRYNSSTNAIDIQTSFPTSDVGRSFERILKTIAASSSLGHRRQIFFLTHGPWDQHGGLIGPHRQTLTEISQALGAFQNGLREIGFDDRVITFTASDFGRTLAGNGKGSDHGWGGNQLVMGGSVRGGDVYGNYPTSLAAGNPLDVGRGRLIPTLSVDQYAAELVMWMGINNDSELETILPNVRNFYASGSTSKPVGFTV